MRPANAKINNRILALVFVVMSFAAVLFIGKTEGRMLDWASAELIYTPPTPKGYSSNCLTENGQTILLADWRPEEMQRLLPILIEMPGGGQTDAAEPETEESLVIQSVLPDTVSVTLSEETTRHLNVSVTAEENMISLLLTRTEGAPGLAQMTQLDFKVSWHGLSGSFVLNMQPYGDLEPLVKEEEPDLEHQINTTLDPVQVCDSITPDRQVMCLQLNLETGSDFKVEFSLTGSPLPMVRWSLDGEHYTLLYDASELPIPYPYPDNWDGMVFLDFSAAIEAGDRPTVAVEATGYSRQEFTPLIKSLPQPKELVLKATAFPYFAKMNTGWGGATPQIQAVERMTADEEGNLNYILEQTIKATVVENGLQIEMDQEGQLPEPGSYRILMQWIWNDSCIEEQIIYFFINTN